VVTIKTSCDIITIVLQAKVKIIGAFRVGLQ